MRNYILICLFLLYAASDHLLANNLTKKGQLDPNCLKTTYTSQIGVQELTGQNDGVQVEAYLKSTGLKAGYAWCAAFVNWCLVQCGYKPCNSAWSPHWFPKERIIFQQGKVLVRPPYAGDVFGIYFPKKKRIAHVGFIHSWGEGKYTTTVEGNTSGNAAFGTEADRNGDGVYKKYRLKSQIYAVSDWSK